MINRIISWFLIVIPPIGLTISSYYYVLEYKKIPDDYIMRIPITLVTAICIIGTVTSFMKYTASK